MTFSIIRLPLCLFTVVAPYWMIPSAPAADWPQWRGPKRDNVSTEVGLLKEWPEGGPPLAWRVEGIGTGIASIAVREGTIYGLGYIGDHEYLTALGEKTGRRRWTTRVGPAVREHPYMRHRCQRMPTVDKEYLYALNGHGQLCCLRTDNGSEIWRKDYAKDFGVKRRTWGILDYPLVDGDRLICLPGGPMWAMVALDKTTGKVIWKCPTAGTDYSSFVVAELGGVRQYVACVAEGVVGVSAKDGKILWKYSKLAHPHHNFTPIVRGDFVVCPSPRKGTVAGLEVTSSDGVFSVEAQYSQQFRLDVFQDGVTWVGDHLYSFRRGGIAACADARTGEIQWEVRSKQGKRLPANVYADGHLYMRDGGHLTLVEANPKKHVEKGTFPLPDADQSLGSTFPVIANGHLLVRADNRLFRYDVRAGQAESRPEPVTVLLSPLQRPACDQSRSAESTSCSVFVPSPHDVVKKMLELADVSKTDLLVDLGSGDGRILIAAAEKFGCRATGYEIEKGLVAQSQKKVAERKLKSLVTIEQQDIFKADFKDANVVCVYLLPKQLEKLLPQLERLKPGTRIVSHQFPIPGIETDRLMEVESEEDGVVHRVFLWTTPLKKSKVP